MIVKSQDGMIRVPYSMPIKVNERLHKGETSYVIHAYGSDQLFKLGEYKQKRDAIRALDTLDGYYINSKSWVAMPQDSEV